MTRIVQEGYAKQHVCAVLEVPRASYYRRCKLKSRTMCAKRQRLRAYVKALFEASGCSYGSRRIKAALLAQDVMVGRYLVRQTMQDLDIRPVWKKAFVRTTDSQHKLPIAENLLDQQFNPTQPNQAWVGDITYIRTQSGWLYLAAVMDLYSRKIVGYAMSSQMTADLVCTALQLAIQMRQPPAGLIVHTDRGSQYCSAQYQSLLSDHGFRCSMSGKGNCYDNAVMERFFLSLKTERVWQQHYANHQEAIRDISRYIVAFYNGVRLHSTLGYQSPNQFEQVNQNLLNGVSHFA
jgi:putative transposase